MHNGRELGRDGAGKRKGGEVRERIGGGQRRGSKERRGGNERRGSTRKRE